MDEKVIAVLGNECHDNVKWPSAGARKVRVNKVLNIKNNVGDDLVYIEYYYKAKNAEPAVWALTYNPKTDKKLAKIFPQGVITEDIIGKEIAVEIGYCDSKNGVYPSVLALDEAE